MVSANAVTVTETSIIRGALSDKPGSGRFFQLSDTVKCGRMPGRTCQLADWNDKKGYQKPSDMRLFM
jgi:hypothetical protein